MYYPEKTPYDGIGAIALFTSFTIFFIVCSFFYILVNKEEVKEAHCKTCTCIVEDAK